MKTAEEYLDLLRQTKMKIIVLGEVIETKEITEIYDIERGKTMFLNRDAGFIIRFMDGSKKIFSENIPYERTYWQIREVKCKWEKLQREVTEKWEKDKHDLQEFGFDVKVSL